MQFHPALVEIDQVFRNHSADIWVAAVMRHNPGNHLSRSSCRDRDPFRIGAVLTCIAHVLALFIGRGASKFTRSLSGSRHPKQRRAPRGALSVLLIQEAAQLAAATWVLELSQGLRLNLADPFSGHAELLTDLL